MIDRTSQIITLRAITKTARDEGYDLHQLLGFIDSLADDYEKWQTEDKVREIQGE